ncbi:MAG: putative glycine dehydrogenase (decarboxylating) subunit 1 [Candidatus Omnitrophica bacterium]|nr:putative glycine dehydrogenase (decarboxylating) subunit 1 [Candidatus Omnitrophota bacterium]
MQYVSNSPGTQEQILKAIGAGSFEDLIRNVPKSIRIGRLNIAEGLSELELVRALDETGAVNRNFKHFIPYLGGGCYDHYVPAVVDRLALRGEFITAYTPYQGEASQGTLQSIYEYQTAICELTGMDYSNASMYDGASSLAEAALLALRHTGRRRVILPASLHPEYAEVVRTYLSFVDCQIVTVPWKKGLTDPAEISRAVDADTAAVIVQQPNFFGLLEDAPALAAAAHQAGALLIACVNPVSLGVVAPPGEYGADIAVGEGQPLGNPVSYGGPHFGFFTVQEPLLRRMPGRICGRTVDKQGRTAYVLTLQAREQHIRREKATSNICTNQALCALKGAIYLSLLGPAGLRRLSLLNLDNAHRAFRRLTELPGVTPFSDGPFFNEFAVRIERDPVKLRHNLLKRRVLGPLSLERFYPDMKNTYLVAVTEKRTDSDLEQLCAAVEES